MARSKNLRVEDVIITDELDRRASRAPDYEAEARALTSLAGIMSSTPTNVLSRLVNLARELTHADSAGISLLEPGEDQGNFRWIATAGAWAPYRDGMMPREESPCGEVIARETVLLLTEPHRAFPALLQADPSIREGLLAPFFIDGAPAGTLWVIKHTPEGCFEAEDARIVTSLAQFASAAHQMVLALGSEQAKRLETEARFQQFSDASTNVLWIRDATTFKMDFVSAAFETIYGRSCNPQDGNTLRCWARMIIPQDRKLVFDSFRRLRAGDRIEQEFRIHRASDGAMRWIHHTDFPMKDRAGRIRWLAGVGMDVTEAKQATERQSVLVAELQHRTRNLIAVVRSLADRTLDNAESLEDFDKRFAQRLAALSRVQGLLSHLATGEKVLFHDLLRAELTAHREVDGIAAKINLEGPSDVPLRSGTVQTLALALHELCTNAIKYGALKAGDGQLTIHWHGEVKAGSSSPRLHIEWLESGVFMPAPSAAPQRGGYGREIIELALPYQHQANTSYELGPDGVRCRINIPIWETRSGDSSHE